MAVGTGDTFSAAFMQTAWLSLAYSDNDYLLHNQLSFIIGDSVQVSTSQTAINNKHWQWIKIVPGSKVILDSLGATLATVLCLRHWKLSPTLVAILRHGHSVSIERDTPIAPRYRALTRVTSDPLSSVAVRGAVSAEPAMSERVGRGEWIVLPGAREGAT